MKKIILIAACAVSLSAYALPVYEPFTEYTTQVTSNPTNAIDLCSNGLVAPSGEVWGGLNYSGKGALSGVETNGIDVLVTNWVASKFTATTLSTILPPTFPGMPGAGQAITTVAVNPAQRIPGATIVGNSAVLVFNSDMTRPTNGQPKTLYISYLFNLAQLGQLGTGNDGRYLAFLAQSNIYEPTAVFPYWSALFNVFGNTAGASLTYPKYCGHGILESNAASAYIGPCDTSNGKDFATSPFDIVFTNGVAFVVGAYTFNASGSDMNSMWVNPAMGSFGGATPPASPVANQTMAFNMSDIAGICLLDRPGNGQSGGVGTNYIANLIVGTTWSYVTGGPEFTTQPPTQTIIGPGGTGVITVAATAAGQGVTYQWQNSAGIVNNGVGGAGGSATVSGATNASLTLAGVSSADSGNYSVTATASGTGYTLNSASGMVTVSDPGILVQPAPTTAVYGGTATFTATAVTTSSKLTYAWYDGSTMIANGLQPDGSTAIGSQGTNNTGGTINLTLTLTNVSCADDGNYSVSVTNAANNSVSSLTASLAVTDPNISVQPPIAVETVGGGTAVIPVTAGGTGITYQWQWNNGNGNDASNGVEISGATASALTISPVSSADAGTYSVGVGGSCGPTVNSGNTVVYVDSAPTGITLSPAAWTQQVGTHLALVGTITGGSGGLIHLLLQLNGTNLSAGLQPDGTTITGPGSILTGPGTGSLVISNLHLGDSGTYTVIASNAAGMVSASSVVTVVPVGQLTLSTNNLEVIRVGDGSQPLSGATGNTLYLDQVTTNGGYVNTIMVPDSGPNAVVVAGAAIGGSTNEGIQEGYMTLSSNQQYLNFGGFCYSYPYTGNPDVTIGGAGHVRGIYALNASGIMALVYTNFGLYSGGHGFRDVFSTDGLTNFWTTGSASGGTVKYVNAGPAGAAYTITSPGNGIPALGETGANAGGVCLGLCGSNLVFSDNESDGDVTASGVFGINLFPGPAPMVTDTNASQILGGGEGHPDDFSFSPDLQTVYVADDDFSTSYSGSTYGGIQRYDLVGGVYTYAYNLSDTTGTGTNGMRGLTVVWPSSITSWGPGVQGAVLYATTSEVAQNRIIQIVDNSGAGSSSTLVATAAPNTFYRGIRFGPVPAPFAVSGPSSQTAEVGQSVDMEASVSGVFSYYFPNANGTAYNLISVPATTYQWFTNGGAIPGATSTELSLANVQTSNAGNYTFVVTTGSTKLTNSPAAVLTVNPFTLSSDLVGWFKLEDGSGTNAIDSSVYASNGYLQNFPADNSEWVPGLGGADGLNFANVDTNNDNVVVAPNAPQLNFSNNLTFTLAAWIKSETNNQVSGAGIINHGFGSGGEQYNLDIYNNAYRFFVRSAAGAVTQVLGSAPPFNQWQHVAAAYDGNAGYMALYLNGQMVGSNVLADTSLLPSTNDVSIGNRKSGATNNYNLPFYGEMQDVRLYNVALGASDVAAIYQPLAPVITGPSQFVASPTAPAFVAPGQFQLNLQGSPNTGYRLWTTTNVALTPVTSTWTLLSTGSFNASGTATFTDTAATIGAKYYSITQP